jgi:nicotinamidase-related amidase
MVLVIDLQDKLLPLIRHNERVLHAGTKLLDAAAIFALPVLATEQYPQGVGSTDRTIRSRLDAAGASTVDKVTMSAWGEPRVRDAVIAIDRRQIITIGIEAHVCVQQTVLDMACRDFDVFVCADGIGSRGRLDYEHALARMRQGGAWITTVESVLFELCQRCDVPQFKPMLEVIKTTPPPDE